MLYSAFKKRGLLGRANVGNCPGQGDLTADVFIEAIFCDGRLRSLLTFFVGDMDGTAIFSGVAAWLLLFHWLVIASSWIAIDCSRIRVARKSHS